MTHPDPDMDYTADWPATLRDLSAAWHLAGHQPSYRLDPHTLDAVADMIEDGEPHWPEKGTS